MAERHYVVRIPLLVEFDENGRLSIEADLSDLSLWDDENGTIPEALVAKDNLAVSALVATLDSPIIHIPTNRIL